MASYHQMGHDSWNLLGEDALSAYGGLILSPVNDSPEETATKINRLTARQKTTDIVLDPQFYKPKSDRGSLPAWDHFSDAFETANLEDQSWWTKCCDKLVGVAQRVSATSVCSPAMIPRSFDSAYYDAVVSCGEILADVAIDSKLEVMLSVIVNVPELAKSGEVERIASLVTKSHLTRIYLVLVDNISPRQQRTDIEAISALMRLIKMLEDSGSRVLVSFTGLDLLLWKSAGASDVATGKFFNLRCFTAERWDEPKEKGRVVEYWTEPTLVSWLREVDVRLLLQKKIIDQTQASTNPYSKQIIDLLEKRGGEPWIALGWRQFMYWFADLESILSKTPSDAIVMLERADELWTRMAKDKILLFERSNDGQWIRSWLNALR